MKSFIVACVVAVVIAVIGGVVLSSVPDTAEDAFSSRAPSASAHRHQVQPSTHQRCVREKADARPRFNRRYIFGELQ